MPAQTKPPPIRACLFDMDGLLLDTEDLYTIVTNQLLHRYNKPSLPWSIKAQLQGRPGPEASRIFHAWAQLTISNDEYMAAQSALQRELFPSAKPLPGVVDLLHTLSGRTAGGVQIALATSSHSGNYKLKTTHLAGLFALFPPECRVLGDDPRIGKGRGKPAPDIYLLALEQVNGRLRSQGAKEEDLIRPEECLVFEDSVPGVEAGRRAGMQVIWCPHPGLREEYKGREEEVLAGLTGEHKKVEDQGERLAQANEVLVQKETGEKRRDGQPGQAGDGWGVYLETLEGFPYERFGISIS
ncbi:Haloacid dehalogenase-like hydrolase [Botryosphaeria dothidea]|uniref:Haloacid dehalogenase-like hydrolase n=1 Tax=Botryosphaeria dothidea TaxID=55169 RepID=A0A8H4IVS7_9PEZI|nr:Haloacid dehalogenase-like hydrolase [Botryosphaeria dothidea]